MQFPDRPRRDRIPIPNRQTAMLAAGLGALAGAAALVWYEQATRNPRPRRRPDSAPGRAARQTRFGRYAVTGRTVTINRPRDELYAFWRDFANLPHFMTHVKEVETTGDLTRWTIRGPLGRDVHIETRIVDERAGEQIAWRSTDASDIDTEGKVMFRDAPAGRGTQVEAINSYVPPAGEIGRWVAKVLQAEPELQARRELKRLKMLMEAGEIATNATRNRRCCTSLRLEDSLCESMPLDAPHEQAITRPLSHDELVQLQRIAAQAGVSADLGRQGHDLARAA